MIQQVFNPERARIKIHMLALGIKTKKHIASTRKKREEFSAKSVLDQKSNLIVVLAAFKRDSLPSITVFKGRPF